MQLQYLLLAAIVPFCSCSVYQLTTLESSDKTASKERGGFTIENDSVRVTYLLGGKYTPAVTVEIVNKLNEPLVIDWKRSAMVYNGMNMAYAKDMAGFSGAIETYNISPNSYGLSQYNDIQGVIKMPKETDFIAPHASIKSALVRLPGSLVNTIPDTALHAIGLRLKNDVPPTTAKYAKFDASNSPLIINSYLTFFSSEKEGGKPIVYLHQFYASEVVRTKEQPDETYYMDEQPGYRYYFKVKGSGGAAGSSVTTATNATPSAGQSGKAATGEVTTPLVKQ